MYQTEKYFIFLNDGAQRWAGTKPSEPLRVARDLAPGPRAIGMRPKETHAGLGKALPTRVLHEVYCLVSEM